MLATPDGFVCDADTGENWWGVEFKTAWGYASKDQWEGTKGPLPPGEPGEEYYAAVQKIAEQNGDRVPPQYLVQCAWCMAVTGHERWYDDWGGNLPAHVAATAAVYDTVPALLAELKRHNAETVALIAN